MQEELFNNNLSITINLLKGLSASFAIPKKFVFISSVSVYGLNYGVKIDENQSLLANDPYGKSKVVAEDIINKWCLENNVICTILRLPLVAGPNPPGNLGAMINGIKNGYYFNISGGNSQKSMVLASDVAKFILKAAEVGGVYNLTDGYHPNFNELSSFIGRQLGKKNVPNMSIFFAKKLAFLGDKILKNFPLNTDKLKKITSTLTFDDSKARKAFGWDPTPVLKGFEIQ
jgi:nucleoside-diphosphate-sugar epimerase